MSLLTTLAYAITAAVRPRVRDAEVAALKAQVDDLRRQLNEVLPRVERQRDDWQALAMRMMRRTPPRTFIGEDMRHALMQAQMLQRRRSDSSAQIFDDAKRNSESGALVSSWTSMSAIARQGGTIAYARLTLLRPRSRGGVPRSTNTFHALIPRAAHLRRLDQSLWPLSGQWRCKWAFR